MGLMPWMDYEFQVIASNILGSGEPSMPSHIIRTQQAGEVPRLRLSHNLQYPQCSSYTNLSDLELHQPSSVKVDFYISSVVFINTLHLWSSAPTVAPSGLGGGGGDRHELIVTWTVGGCLSVVYVYIIVGHCINSFFAVVPLHHQ